MTIKDTPDVEQKKRAVSFNTRVTVVLIPERKEIREAQCDLWWARGDYSTFQQSAHSEIRLFALYENINCKEAKTILYQPNQAGETEPADDDDFEPEDDLDMNSRDSELEEQDTCLSAPAPLMRHVDSVSLLSGYNSNEVVTPMKISKSNSSMMNIAEIAKIVPAASEDPHFYVSLCVPSVQFESLAMSVSNNSVSNSCKSGHRSEQGNGFAVVCGIFSFTLPIIGYYLMHYSS